MDSLDSGIVFGSDDECAQQQQEVESRKRKRRNVKTTLWAAIFGTQRCSYPKEVSELISQLVMSEGARVNEDRDSDNDDCVLLGGVELEWSVHAPATPGQAHAMQTLANVAQRRQSAFFVHYMVKDIRMLPVAVTSAPPKHGRMAPVDAAVALATARRKCKSTLVSLVCWQPLAIAILQGSWRLVHCAGFGSTSRRLRMGLAGIPSMEAARGFAKALPEIVGDGTVARGRGSAAPLRLAFEPHSMVRFLRASRHLRVVGAIEKASTHMLQAMCPDAWAAFVAAQNVRWPGRACLHLARVRFDMAMSLAQRALSKDVAVGEVPVDSYLLLDGSPTSGFEAMAMMQQDFLGNELEQRLLPFSYLGYGHMAAKDKLFALLWAVFLECGPGLSAMRWRLRRVRGLCTDFGAESVIVDSPDVLPEFAAAIGLVPHSSQAQSLEAQPFLFMRAFWTPGWQHSCDVAFRDTLYKLDFFPACLKRLKACVAWLRCDSYRQALAREACAQSQDGRVFELVPPGFAHWRWGTLRQVARYFLSRASLFAQVWSIALFPSLKAPSELREVNSALTDPVFWGELRIVGDIADEFHMLRSWGQGCACHSEARLGGQVVRCAMQGRRLPEATSRVKEFIGGLLSAALEPRPGSFCAGGNLPQELQLSRSYAFRCGAAVVERTWTFLEYMPYSLARARERSVMERCWAEFQATPQAKQRRVSVVFFGEEWVLREHVQAYLAGGRLHEELGKALLSVERVPMTEECIESPRAVMQREKRRQSAGSRAWMASSLRLKQNLDHYDRHFRRRRHAATFVEAWSTVSRLTRAPVLSVVGQDLAAQTPGQNCGHGPFWDFRCVCDVLQHHGRSLCGGRCGPSGAGSAHFCG